MKKGFTLVEMLGVLVILALIFILSFPNVINHIVNGEESVDKASEKNIIESAKDYVSKNEINRELEKYCLTLNELVIKGYLRKDSISDSLKDKIVEIGISKKRLNYSLVDECSATTSNVITLIGNKRIKVEINGTYNEQGATAKDKNMVDISSQIVKTIYNGKGQVVTDIDTTKLGNYSIEYVLSIDGVEDKIYRDVDIVDTTKPIITIPEITTKILPTITTFNLLNGVSVSDNSGETLNVSVKTNLALGAIGTYSITYSAKDSSGNEGTIKRRVIVIGEVYRLGQLVYFDPVSEAACSEDTYIGTNTCYKWRVIETEDNVNKNDITLQMDHNLLNTCQWAYKIDDETGKKVGPVSIFYFLNRETASWTRVDYLNYEYDTSSSSNGYGKLVCSNSECTINGKRISENVRARIITGEEVQKIVNTKVSDPSALSKQWTINSKYNSYYAFSNKNYIIGTYTPGEGNIDLKWMVENTKDIPESGATSNGKDNSGYWTLSVTSDDTTFVWEVGHYGNLSSYYYDNPNFYGIRPVISISKDKIN